MARTETAAESENLFDDCELGPEDILGERSFSGRLYSPKTAEDVMNVNVLTGEQTHDIPSAEAVAAWVAEKNEEARLNDTDRVALVAGSGEQLYESRSLLSLAAFYHMDVTSYKLHFAYNAAVRSDDYTVEYDADYENGTITITVEEA